MPLPFVLILDEIIMHHTYICIMIGGVDFPQREGNEVCSCRLKCKQAHQARSKQRPTQPKKKVSFCCLWCCFPDVGCTGRWGWELSSTHLLSYIPMSLILFWTHGGRSLISEQELPLLANKFPTISSALGEGLSKKTALHISVLLLWGALGGRRVR